MKNKGFSLVELIVVIAIMAILVGVAVPVYTSYIEKASISSDKQMVGEIKHAIEIAAVGDNWYLTASEDGKGGYIILTTNGDPVIGGDLAAEITKALEDTFGSTSELRLEYDGWKGTLSGSNLGNFVNSTFKDNTETLMGDVQSLTNALEDFMVNQPNLLFGSAAEDYMDFLKENEIIPEGTTEADLPTYSQQAANGATLLVANSTRKISADDFAAKWCGLPLGGLMVDSELETAIGFMSGIAAEYARAEALVNRINCPALTTQFQSDTQNLGLAGLDSGAAAVTTKAEVRDNISEMIVNATTHIFGGCTHCGEAEIQALVATYAGSGTVAPEALADAHAYYVVLGQVKESSNEIVNNIESDNVYSEGSVPALVKGYISTAVAMQQALSGVSVADGQVAIVINQDAKGNLFVVAYPIDPYA